MKSSTTLWDNHFSFFRNQQRDRERVDCRNNRPSPVVPPHTYADACPFQVAAGCILRTVLWCYLIILFYGPRFVVFPAPSCSSFWLRLRGGESGKEALRGVFSFWLRSFFFCIFEIMGGRHDEIDRSNKLTRFIFKVNGVGEWGSFAICSV